MIIYGREVSVQGVKVIMSGKEGISTLGMFVCMFVFMIY